MEADVSAVVNKLVAPGHYVGRLRYVMIFGLPVSRDSRERLWCGAADSFVSCIEWHWMPHDAARAGRMANQTLEALLLN